MPDIETGGEFDSNFTVRKYHFREGNELLSLICQENKIGETFVIRF